jgi:hypothetical protein
MSKTQMRWIITAAVVVAAVVLTVWAASARSPMVSQASDEWSRGRIVGFTAINRPVALRPFPEGGALMLWPTVEGNLQMLQVDAEGEVVRERFLPLDTANARDPQVQVRSDGRFHLLWREGSGADVDIRYALVELDGTPVREPLTLATATDLATDVPRLLADGAGRVHALWVDNAGVQYAVLSEDGTVVEEPALVAPGGQNPAAQFDGEGRLHMAWRQRVEGRSNLIYYAARAPQGGGWSEPLELELVFLRTGQRIEGPTVGLDAQTVYVFWSIEDRRAVVASSHYVYFPIDGSGEAQAEDVVLRWGWDPVDVYPLDGQRASLQVALSGTTPEAQSRMLLESLFSSGQASGAVPQVVLTSYPQTGGAEDIVTASRQACMEPTLVMDADANLHLSALQIAGGDLYRVFYASTAPDVMANYNAVTSFDVVNVVFNALLQVSLFVLGVIPMLFLWAVVPLLGLIVYHWLSGDEELEKPRAWAALALTLGLEFALTLAFPLRTDLRWPELRWVGPVATAAIAGVITWLLLRRRDQNLLFLSFFVFSGVNILTLWLAYFVI